jgi:hypothetical protein
VYFLQEDFGKTDSFMGKPSVEIDDATFLQATRNNNYVRKSRQTKNKSENFGSQIASNFPLKELGAIAGSECFNRRPIYYKKIQIDRNRETNALLSLNTKDIDSAKVIRSNKELYSTHIKKSQKRFGYNEFVSKASGRAVPDNFSSGLLKWDD